MTFEIEIGGHVRTVSVESIGAAGPAGGQFRLLLRDAPRAADAPDTPDAPDAREAGAAGEARARAPEAVIVDCRPTDLGLSLLFPDGRIVDVAATEHTRGEWLLQLPHVDVAAVVDRRRRERRRPGATAGAGEQRITAPMPGRVVRLMVKAGDQVALRQGLVVVEAMKMENELTSPKAGRIKEVAVAEGVTVEAGRLLMVVD